jgi:hypothetical protein
MKRQIGISLLLLLIASLAPGDEPPDKLKAWLRPQSWERDTAGPVLSLGESGGLDDTHIFAPAVIHENGRYLVWYVDVKQSSWTIRHATSDDGRGWRVSPEPCLRIHQAWECTRLFYPTVLRIDGVYMMWYGSYWRQRGSTTALGFAVSLNGLKWYRHPDNPVLRPDPGRRWESHYVTSQSVMKLPDLGLHPTPRRELSCLEPDELGSPEFTVAGWLQEIEQAQG